MCRAKSEPKNENAMPRPDMIQNGTISFMRWLLPRLPQVQRRLRLYAGSVARQFAMTVASTTPITW